MKPARLFLLFLLGLIASIFGLTTWFVYREHRQERLNRDLIAAVVNNYRETVVSLLDQGADANCHDEPYRPSSWWQMLRDRLQSVKPKLSTAPTPLMLALPWPFPSRMNVYPPENLSLVKALLDHNADVNVRDENGITPLHWAVINRRKALLYLLLKYGADMRLDSTGFAPLVEVVYGFTLIPGEIANRSDVTDILSDMLHRGADVNQHSQDGTTALWLFVEARDVEAVRLLLSYHADVTIKNWTGLAPLSLAQDELLLAHSKEDIVKAQQIIHLLQQAGAKE